MVEAGCREVLTQLPGNTVSGAKHASQTDTERQVAMRPVRIILALLALAALALVGCTSRSSPHPAAAPAPLR
jgi:hypothetical protein